jgi:hypothetical protein
MADLGALNLILGADISPLEASLGRADELINRSAAQMQKSFGKAFKFKVEVGDLAVQLTQAEGVVDRSIRQVRTLVRQPIKFNIETGELNVQLTEAEALVSRTLQDIKAMDRSIAFNLSVRGLDDVEGLVARSIQQMSALSNSVLTVQVDDKRLTELNQHLDAKQAHYARVQQQFATPLKVLVDDSQLTTLNQHLTATEQHLSTVAGKFAATKLTPAIDLTNLNLLDRRLNNSIDNLHHTQSEFSHPIITNVDTRQLLQLEDLIDRVERPHKLRLDLPDTLGKLTSDIAKLALSPISIPVKIAQNAVKDIFTGFFHEVGAGISDGIGARKYVRKQSQRAGDYARTVDQELIGVEDYSATYLSEIIRSGDPKTAHKVATRSLKANKHIENAQKLKAVATLADDYDKLSEVPELVELIPEHLIPAFNELGGKKFMGKHGKTKLADGSRLGISMAIRAKELKEELAPTGVIQNVLNPFLQTISPGLNFINKVQVNRAITEAHKQTDTIASTLPQLQSGQTGYLNVIGGAQYRQGRGHQEITAAFEGVVPDRRLLGVDNPETDPGGTVKPGGIASLLHGAVKKFAPEILNDSTVASTLANGLTLFERSLDPTFYSTAVSKSLGNVLAAKKQGVDPSKVGTLSYSFGGADARDIASGLNLMGMPQSKVLAMAMPDINAYKPPMANFQATLIKPDAMGFPKQLGIGSNANLKTFEPAGVREGADAHFYGHYFKSAEQVDNFHNFLGTKNPVGDFPPVLKSGKQLNRTLHADRQINSFIDTGNFDLSAPYKGQKGGSTVLDFIKEFLEGTAVKPTDPDSYDPAQRAIYHQSAAKFKTTDTKLRQKLKDEGAPESLTTATPGEFKANFVMRADALKLNQAIEVFKNGTPKGDDYGYFSGNINPDLIRKRLPDAVNAIPYFTKELDQKSPSAQKLIATYQSIADTMKEFLKTGTVSQKTKDSLQFLEYEPNQYLDGLNGVKLDMSKLPTHESQQTTARNQPSLIEEELKYGDLARQYREEDRQKAAIPKPPATPSIPIAPTVDPIENERFRQETAQRRANIAKEKERSRTKGQPINLAPQPQSESELALVSNSGSSIVPSRIAAAKFVIDSAQIVATGVVKIGGNALTAAYGAEQALLGRGGAKVVNTLAASTAMSQLPGGAEAISMVGHGISGLANMPLAHLAGQSSEAIGGFLTQALGNIPLAKSIVPQLTAQITEALAGGAAGVSGTIGSIVAPFVTGFAALKSAKAGVNLIAPGALGNKQLAAGSEDFALRALRGFGNAARSTSKFVRRAALPPGDDVIDGELIETPILSGRKYRAIGSIPQRKEQRPILQISGTERRALPASQFATNIQAIDVGDAKAIESEVARVKSVIANNRKKIQAKLKSKDPQELAEGLSEAAAFGYGLNILKGDLQSAYGKIAPTKLSEPQNVKSLETSRTTIGGLIGSIEGGGQTKIINERIADIAKDNNLVDKVGSTVSTKGQNNIFDKIKASFARLPKDGGNDAGFVKIEALLASLIGAAALPVIGAPVAIPAIVGGGLIAALKKSTFARSHLGQTRIPGLGFLDKLKSKEGILSGLLGLGMATSIAMTPTSIAKASDLTEQQLMSEMAEAKIDNGPRITPTESKEYNTLLNRKENKQRLTQKEELKKVVQEQAEERTIFPDAYYEIEPQELKKLKKENPALYKIKSKSGVLSPTELNEYKQLYKDELELKSPLEKEKFKHYGHRIDYSSYQELEEQGKRPTVFARAIAFNNKLSPENKEFFNYHTTRKIKIEEDRKNAEGLEALFQAIGVTVASGLGMGALAKKLEGNGDKQESTEAKVSKFRLPQIPKVSLPVIKIPEIPLPKISPPQIPKLPTLSLPELSVGTKIDKLRSSYAEAQERFKVSLPVIKIPEIPLPKISPPQIPKLPTLSLPELSVGTKIDKLRSSYAEAQERFKSITNGIAERVKSSWQQHVDGTKTRVEQFKSSAVNAARSITSSNLEPKSESSIQLMELNLLSNRTPSDKVTTLVRPRLGSALARSPESQPILSNGIIPPAKPPAPIPPKNPKLDINDPWQENGSFPTPIPPKQSNPSSYPQHPDPWAKRPAAPIPPSPKSLIYHPNTHFPVDGQIDIEQERIKRNSQPNRLPKNPLIPEVEKSESALTKLTNVGKLALGVFGGFTLASLAVPAMIALGKSTIDTATNFETLQVKLAAASDSAQTGKQTFSRLTGEADKLGISRSSALETGAFIGGTTFGTELEGKPTDRMTSQILQIAQARGLNKQQTDGLNLALAQTLGRSRTSMQEINQLTQSAGITDARVIAAKGLGYTPQQFSAIQESPTGIDSKRFVQAFLAQGVQDSLSAKDLAQNSIGFKQTKLSAGVERLQGDVGAGISPAFKAGLDLLTGSIELLNFAIENSSKFLIGLGIKLLYVGGAALLPMIRGMNLASIAANSFTGSIVNIGIGIRTVLPQMLLMAVAGEVITQVANEFKNSSQEIQDAADKIGTSIDEINGKKIDTIDKPKTAEEIGGKDWGETTKLWLQRANSKAARGIANFFSPITGKKDTDYTDESFGVDSKQKEQSDRAVSVNNVLDRSSTSIGKVDAAIKNAQKLTEIDLEINRLDSQRSGLFSGGSPDAGKLADINAKYNAKYQERDALTSDITPTKNSIQETINGLKGTKAKLQLDFSKGQIAVPDYELEMALVADKLQDAEQAQRKLNDAIKSGFDNLLPWTTSLDKIVASFDDIKTKAEESAQKLSIGRNNLERGGNLTKGEAEYQGSIDKQSNIQTQIKQTIATIKELRAALLTKDGKAIENVQKNYGVDDSTSGAQLRLKADKATSVVDKEILSKLAIIKDKEINLTGLQSQFSDARTEMYRRIEQENRDAMLYYVGLAKQIDPQGTAFTKAIAQVTQDKNKLLSKLQGYGNGMFDGYIGAILDLFESSKKKLETLAQYSNTRKSAIDGFNDRAYQAESTARNAFNAPGQQSGATSNYPSGQTENPPARTNSSAPVEQPAPQERASAPPKGGRTVRSAKPTTPSEYTRSGSNSVKPQIDAALKRLTPEERNRYLNTTLSVNGKTDLGLDDYDRNVLGLKDRPKSSIPPAPTSRSSISPSPVPQPPSQLISQPASSSPVSGSSKVGRVQPITVGSWVQQSQAASQKIFEQEMQRGQSQLDTAFSDSEFQNITSELKAKREGKQAEQQVRRTARTQQRSLKGLKPTLTIQEKQDRELETFNDTASDSKEDFATFRQNMTDSVGDLYTVIKYLDSRTDLTPGQKTTLADAKARAARLGGTLKTVNTNFSQIDDKVKAARDRIVEQQGYDRDVAVEQTGIKERETKRSGIEAQRTGVQQTLRSQPFNSSLNASDRQLEEDAAIIAIQNEEIQALRALTEQERGGSLAINRSPAQIKAYVAAQQAKIKATSERKRKDVSENRAQKSRDFDFNVDTENRTFDAGKLQQEATGFDIGSRRQTALDRTDAPFANNNSIDRVYTRKIKELDLELEAAKETLRKKNERYKGVDPTSTGLRARAGQEFTEAKRQIELKRSTATLENSADTADRERSRRGVLYGNQIANFDSNFAIVSAQTQQRKLMGQDTREQDYQAQKLTKQKEFSQKEFDLNQQRSQITGMSTEAIAARAQIDGLLTNLQALEKIELSNLSAQFNQLNQVIGETQKATSDTFKELLKDTSTSLFDDFFGGKTQKEKALSDKNLKKYLGKILSSPFEAFGNQMIDKLVPNLFSGLYQKSPQGAGSQPQQTGDVFSGLLNGLFGGLFGGGAAAPVMGPGYATGGIKNGLATISNGIIGSGRSQIDNRIAIVEDGEAIITHRGIDALGGPSAIAKINRGDVPRFANGGVKGANYSTPRPNTSPPNIGNRSANLNNVSANVTINNSDGKSSVTTQEDGSRLGRLVNNAISAALVKEQRAGGLLYR